MSSILPKGIVVNTPEISGDIERIDREPLALDEIAKFWKVYTTTKRRLIDPTAERLENFWWRIWGSRKRNLRGATVARIFSDISNEISFVPLRGPLNRDESGSRLTAAFTRGPGTASTTAMPGRQESDSSSGRHSSSLSKSIAAMPPPILKKSRGPSTTGPRPTARFISPHTSEDDDTADLSPTMGPGAQVVIRPPTPPLPISQVVKNERRADASAGSRKKAQGFAATAGGHKSRPGTPRRPNSDPTFRAQESGLTTSSKDLCKSLPEKTDEKQNAGISQDSIDIYEQPLLSTQTLMPTNTSKRKTRSDKSGHSKMSVHQSSAPGRDVSAPSSTAFGLLDEVETLNQPRTIEKRRDYISKADGLDRRPLSKVNKNAMQGACPDPLQATSGQSSKFSESSSTLHSEKGAQLRPSERHLAKILDGKSSSSVAPVYNTAIGETVQRNTLDFETAKYKDSTSSQNDVATSFGRPEQASLFAKRPVEPVRSASALFENSTHQSNDSMSRSKSQLTFLLERDGAKEREMKDRSDSTSKTKDAKSK